MIKRPSSVQVAALTKALAQVYGTNVPDFDRALELLYTPFKTEIIDCNNPALTSAQGLILNIAGDFIYVDPDTSALNPTIGTLTIEPNDQTSADLAAFTANPGFALNCIFKSIKVRASGLQPGKRLALKYSTGFSVVPSFAALNSISGIVSTLLTDPFFDAITQANQAFAARATTAAVAAQNGFLEVYNPAASGIFLYIDKFNCDPQAASTSYSYGFSTTALATDIGTQPNKNQAGAASISHARSTTAAASPAGTTLFGALNSPSTAFSIERTFSPPLRIPPGAGFIVSNNTANQPAGIDVDFREKTS